MKERPLRAVIRRALDRECTKMERAKTRTFGRSVAIKDLIEKALAK